MSTNVPRLQSYFSFLHHFVMAKLAISSTINYGLNILFLMFFRPSSIFRNDKYAPVQDESWLKEVEDNNLIIFIPIISIISKHFPFQNATE